MVSKYWPFIHLLGGGNIFGMDVLKCYKYTVGITKTLSAML